jgi:DNA polymerase-3 subunit alpha
MSIMDWDELKQKVLDELTARSELKSQSVVEEYRTRLEKEFYEIIKQGANTYWCELVTSGYKCDTNPAGLVLAWLLGLTPIDPIAAGIKHTEVYQTDFPDIDLDFLPIARDPVKEHAVLTYTPTVTDGTNPLYVCSVGNWITYLPKSALQDVARAMGSNVNSVIALTKDLPDEFDELGVKDHEQFRKNLEDPDAKVRADAHREIARYQPFYDFAEANPTLVDIAFRLVGKIKAQGTHAGGIIIADRDITNLVPMSYLGPEGKRVWTSQWTEGKKTQLSKFGLVKFDILGVKTIYYIWQAGNLIKKNRGIEIDWTRMDPTADEPFMGFEKMEDGTEVPIPMNDEVSLEQCNSQRTDSVFQIETDIQKHIISQGGVKDFKDLVAYNALGRPGPMEMIPEYIARRDDATQKWRDTEDPRITEMLASTYGIIVFQEQLQAMWMQLAKFTTPEAEAARKVVSKKWVDKLPKIEEQWKKGASSTIGAQVASQWWEKMVDFGRYCFNKSHAVAYSIVTYRCLYLKAHYPAEWWAAVMTMCQPWKLSNYMSAARLDGVKFSSMDANHLTIDYTVKGDQVIPGLVSVKGAGKKACQQFTGVAGPFTDIDDFVAKCGKSKNIMERLIKLGAFDQMHPNRRGLWAWYQYKYASGKEITILKKSINNMFAWTKEQVETEQARQAKAYFEINPKKSKLPKKILDYKGPKVVPTRDQVLALFDDYSPGDILKIEKQFLGYYWTSPLDMYLTEGYTIEQAKVDGFLEAVIETVAEKRAKKSGNKFYILHVTDGVQTADVLVWSDIFHSTPTDTLKPGVGVRIAVDYNEERKGFKIRDDSFIIPLIRKDSPQAQAFSEACLAPTREDCIW